MKLPLNIIKCQTCSCAATKPSAICLPHACQNLGTPVAGCLSYIFLFHRNTEISAIWKKRRIVGRDILSFSQQTAPPCLGSPGWGSNLVQLATMGKACLHAQTPTCLMAPPTTGQPADWGWVTCQSGQPPFFHPNMDKTSPSFAVLSLSLLTM